MKLINACLVIIIAIHTTGCSADNIEVELVAEQKENEVFKAVAVEVSEVQYGEFISEIFTTGKVFAIKNAEIRFALNETIEAIYIQNGDRLNHYGLEVHRFGEMT